MCEDSNPWRRLVAALRSHRLLRLLLIVSCATACASGPTTPTGPPTALTLPLAAAAWQTISDPQPYPLRNEGNALVFDFPSSGSMHYLFTPSPIAAIRGTIVVSLQIIVEGAAVFEPLDTSVCNLPPSVRPFLWANNNGSGNFDRWWSNPMAYPLAAGTATLSVPLQAEHWSSVNGRLGNENEETRFGFERALLNVTRLGLTFGGGCSFGHGIRVTGGTAKFTLSEYAIR
jgi:hypothetical protein